MEESGKFPFQLADKQCVWMASFSNPVRKSMIRIFKKQDRDNEVIRDSDDKCSYVMSSCLSRLLRERSLSPARFYAMQFVLGIELTHYQVFGHSVSTFSALCSSGALVTKHVPLIGLQAWSTSMRCSRTNCYVLIQSD